MIYLSIAAAYVLLGAFSGGLLRDEKDPSPGLSLFVCVFFWPIIWVASLGATVQDFLFKEKK